MMAALCSLWTMRVGSICSPCMRRTHTHTNTHTHTHSQTQTQTQTQTRTHTRTRTRTHTHTRTHTRLSLNLNLNVPCAKRSTGAPLRVTAESSSSGPKARFVAKRTETTSVKQLQRPLVEYMSLPVSQYSVLDAERIERLDENTFRCYVYRLKFFSFEVCPVLLVRVEEQPNGCCIRLLSCKLEGSPQVVAQNERFSASMINIISCNTDLGNASVQQLTSDTSIEVVIDIPFAFQAIPVQAIELTGTQVLEQLLKIMLPRFLKQLVKDYQAWASGDTSRQPLGTGQI